jgi:bacterioferritin-associated ferredoxin
MIVCHCYRVSDRQIRQCAQEGASTVSEVGRACGAGAGCGGCRPEIGNILTESTRTSDRCVLPVLQAV